MRRNTEYFLRKHATFDIEVFSYSSEATASLKVPIYEEMIASFLAQRLGNVTASILELVPQDVPLLVIGTWLDDSRSPSDKTICYDHSRPPSEGNKHQLGMATVLEDGAMEAVINVDFWRFLMPYDLNKLVEDYVADMLGHRRTITSSTIDGADVLRVS